MSMSNSILVAGSVGVVANYALFSQYTPVSVDLLLKDISVAVHPLSALKTLLPALFGFLGGTLLLLFWNYLKSRVVRFLLKYDNWFLKPKAPINAVWYALMMVLVGQKNKGLGCYQDMMPSLPVPPLAKTARKYLDSVRPLLSAEEYKETQEAVKIFVEKDGKKLQWLLKFRSWRMRNWMADWWLEFIYLRQRTPICFNSNYYALCQHKFPSHHMLDRAATILHHCCIFCMKLSQRSLDNSMATKFAPFCSENYHYLSCSTRIPGEEKDEIFDYHKEKPTHAVIYRQGRYYQIEVLSPVTGEPHSPITIRRQLEHVVAMAGDIRDNIGVQNLTSLPRLEWAKIRRTMLKSGVNRRSLHSISSSISLAVLETEAPVESDLTAQARLMFHGDGYSRWFDKIVTVVVCSNGCLGANVEHSSLDATVCGHLWEYVLVNEQYDAHGHCVELYPGEQPVDTPPPTVLKWEVDGLKDEIKSATSSLAAMIQDSDLLSFPAPYGKRLPKKFKLSPDGWFQMSLQLAHYRLHQCYVLTYESATTRLFFNGRTETIRPVSDHSCAFVQAMQDTTIPREQVKALLKAAIKYQQKYKMEAMRGLGVDRHLFGLYVVARGMKLDPMPKMFTDKAFNLSFLLSTSQTPVKTSEAWTMERSTCLGGFGAVCDEGYGISYIVVGEDQVNFSVHSKKSCTETNSKMMCDAIHQAFEDMRNLYVDN